MLRLRATQVLLKSKKPAAKPQLNANQALNVKKPAAKPAVKPIANVQTKKTPHAPKSAAAPAAKPALKLNAKPFAKPTATPTSKPSSASSTIKPAVKSNFKPNPKPSAHPSSKPTPQTNSSPPIRRPFGRIALGGAFFVVFLLSGYTTFVYISYRRDAAEARARGIPADVSDRYQRSAETFDEDVGSWERRLGVLKLREELAAKARGHVLEMSVGTGRNIPYLRLLDGAVESVTMVDQSSEMVRMARKKWTDSHPWFIHTSFRVQSAALPVPRPAGQQEDGFDTVLQTMGICSTSEPEAVLRSMGRLCKRDGRILLLEHGKSYYAWLNGLLDQFAPAHADRHGCWWNKDIGEIVERSGLEVVEMKRFNLGTTWWYELKPGKVLEEEEQQVAKVMPDSIASLQRSVEDWVTGSWAWARREWKQRTSS